MNDSGTSASICAETVPQVRTTLIKSARDFGPDTPAGRRCFNLDEMLQNRETATGEALDNLNYQIGLQVRDLARLSSSDPKGHRGGET